MPLTNYMTTREEATFIWLAVGLAACVCSRTLRQSMASVGRALAQWKVLTPVLAFAGLIVISACLVNLLGLWFKSLTGAVVIWFLFTGFRYLLDLSDIPRSEHFFRQKLLELIGIGAVFEFFLNIRTFSLFVEMPLIFCLTFLVALQVFAASREQDRRLARVIGWILSLTGLILVVVTARNLVVDRAEIEARELASLFLVPVWLTFVTVPYLYVLALIAGYESLFLAMRRGNDYPASRAVRLGAIAELRGRTRDIAQFRGQRLYEAVTAGTVQQTRQAVRSMRADRAERAAADAAAERRLSDNAGVSGADDDGRQLDEREFKQTREALQWIAVCQMGWYRRAEDGGRYRADLLERLGNDFTRQGLPQDSGFEMKVSEDGQAWYAHRRTVSGWVFAIGASEAPPNQWLYDGDHVPDGFPGSDASWGASETDASRKNW